MNNNSYINLNNFKIIVNEINSCIQEIKSSKLSLNDKLKIIIFLDRIVEIVELSTREIFRVMTELKYISDDNLNSRDINNLRKNLEMLKYRDKYRDVDFLCGRLHVLKTEFNKNFHTKIQNFDQKFHHLLTLIDDREGELVRIVSNFIHNFDARLNELERSLSNLSKAKEIRNLLIKDVNEGINSIKTVLSELFNIHESILPFAGNGLIDVLMDHKNNNTIFKINGDFIKGDKFTAGKNIIQAKNKSSISHEKNKSFFESLTQFIYKTFRFFKKN